RTLLDEPAARLALVFTAFWYELVSYGHRATIDALAAYAAFATLALVFADSRRRVAVAAGALAGLTFILRFQLSPLLGVLGRLAPVAAGLLLAGFAIVSVLGLSDRLPFETRVLRPNIARNVARDAYRALAADDDVIAVLDASGSDGWYLAPYYDLHHDVPLYWPLSDGYQVARADPTRYA